MSNLKYYTPSIEEVHHGFEYEFHYMVEGWKKEHFEKMDFNYLAENIKEELIRVKYLDKEDIESLGFIDISAENSPFDIKSFTYKSEVLTLSKDGFVQIYHADLQKTLRGFLFMGTVKNKSELARLLKQLNIQ